MITILFVDDEPNVVRGLQRSTRAMRDQWEVLLTTDTAEALEMVGSRTIDVVVSDMRMPGMDGAEFLTRVRALSPATVRVVLSGFSDEASLARATETAHQFLSKPLDILQLTEALERIRGARSAIDSPAVLERIGGIHHLPSLDATFHRLAEAIEAENTSYAALGQIIEGDVGLTAEILRLTNSAFFNLNRQIESVPHAISMIGLDVVRSIVAYRSAFHTAPDTIDLETTTARSHAVAELGRRISLDGGCTNLQAATAFLTGMLHQVGVLVLAAVGAADGLDVGPLLDADDAGLERLTFGVDRFAAGAYLLGIWGFETSTSDAVRALGAPVDQSQSDSLTGRLRLAYEIERAGLAPRLLADPAEAGALIDELQARLDADGSLSAIVSGPTTTELGGATP